MINEHEIMTAVSPSDIFTMNVDTIEEEKERLLSCFKPKAYSNIKNFFWNCGYTKMSEINFGNAFAETSKITDLINILLNCGTSTCKYYVSSETAQNWFLNLDSVYRRTDNWNTEYIIVQ